MSRSRSANILCTGDDNDDDDDHDVDDDDDHDDHDDNDHDHDDDAVNWPATQLTSDHTAVNVMIVSSPMSTSRSSRRQNGEVSFVFVI